MTALAPPGWADGVSAALVGGQVQGCDAGHGLHLTVPVSVRLAGRAIPDWPAPPAGFERSLDLMVYDAPAYRDTVGYCTGDDEVSRSLLQHGSWEGFETALALVLLDGGFGGHVGWMVDLGAHVGWYTLLAASSGCPVIAVEANPETLSVLRVNADLNGCSAAIVYVRGWVGPDTPQAPAGGRIRLLKADIEGLEADAVRVFEPALAAQEIDYLMLELTASFNDRWREAVDTLTSHGYRGYRIPDKPDRVNLHAYSTDPLGVVLAHPLGDLTGQPQVNALFVRDGLT